MGIFLFIITSRPDLGLTKPPVKWVLGTFSLEVKRLGRGVTSHLHLVARSKKPGAIPPLPNTSS
jgi:hypothetical protein